MRNALGSAASLYLRQHAQQPVHWCEWSPEVLERAAAEGKWLLVSIGYSTCHWCHVMAHEVFDDPEVAAVLNERWISIKVDREERPDLDQAYMAACLAMTGQGGWPLNAICLPDGRPVWAATYLPKERFLAALHELALVKTRHGLQAEDYAAQVAEAVQGTEPEAANDVDIPTAVHAEVAASWDLFWGGFRGAPKFPLPSTWVASVRWASLQDWPEASAHAERTVASLLRSGTYDLLRGGLFRYSTDGAWVVPHFEKMLYDSAQFASLCALVGSPIALEGMRETLAFMERDLLREDGLFAAALDADHPEGEGRHYTWTEAELDTVFGTDLSKERGAWKSLLERESRLHEGAWVLAAGPADANDPRSLPGFTALRTAALGRPLPVRDTKCVLAWNALAVTAFADGYLRTGAEPDRARLIRLATAHRSAFSQGATHVHYPDGTAKGPAFLDDSIYSLQMAIRCGQVLLDPEWIGIAAEWFETARTRFAEGGRIRFSRESMPGGAFANTLNWDDDVLPNPLSTWAECALILGHIRQNAEWISWARSLISKGLSRASTAPSRHTSWYVLAALAAPDTPHWLIVPHVRLGARSIPKSPLWGPMEREASVYAQLCRMDACTFAAATETEFNDGPNPFS